jgi:putative acetyltransferase
MQQHHRAALPRDLVVDTYPADVNPARSCPPAARGYRKGTRSHTSLPICWTGVGSQREIVERDPVLIRRENAADVNAIRAITAAAFARPGEDPPDDPPEAGLVDELRDSTAWLPALSLVATTATGEIVGHVLCTRGTIDQAPVLALGPLTVRPDYQRRGVGSALMHAIIGAGDALGEPLIALLGDPAYYARFGFRPSTDYQITPPKADWQPHFQVRTLTSYQPTIHGTFSYPEPFDRV